MRAKFDASFQKWKIIAVICSTNGAPRSIGASRPIRGLTAPLPFWFPWTLPHKNRKRMSHLIYADLYLKLIHNPIQSGLSCNNWSNEISSSTLPCWQCNHLCFQLFHLDSFNADHISFIYIWSFLMFVAVNLWDARQAIVYTMRKGSFKHSYWI